jgi:hypothetical protein
MLFCEIHFIHQTSHQSRDQYYTQVCQQQEAIIIYYSYNANYMIHRLRLWGLSFAPCYS